jgi:2,3-bisphosphoglycerate-dependent phosphoglycerate mutase
MHTVVLVRHGQSLWNSENRFAGWVDVGLSPLGRQEAVVAGTLLKDHGFTFNLAYTSFLRRANQSLEILLDAMDLLWIPENKAWWLNERHYGALQGANRVETRLKYGDEQFSLWRRSYSERPPLLRDDSPLRPSLDRRYVGVAPATLPLGESLQDCSVRVLTYWSVEIVPQILSGAKILICAHGSTMRALLKHLKRISDKDIAEVNIPTAVPLVLRFDNALTLVEHSYLGDPEAIQRQIDLVASQGSQP